MRELDIVVLYECDSIHGPKTVRVGPYTVSGLFHERVRPHCTCPAYRFSKPNTYGEKHCKHIDEAERDETLCGWHQQTHGGEPVDGKCPRCGAPAHAVRVAI